MKTNLRLINCYFYSEDNAMVPSFSHEVSEFTAKSNNAALVTDTLMTMGDSKKGKSVSIAKTITPKTIADDVETIKYKHTNKYIEKYKSINTTLSLNDDTNDVYVTIALPFNGNISEFSIDNNAAVISAHCVMVPAIKFNENDKLLYGKICYLMIKISPNDAGEFADTTIKFTTLSSRWSDDKTSCSQTARNIVAVIPAKAITEVDEDEAIFVVPTVESTNIFDALLNAEGKLATPPIRFNNLFKIPVDRNIKNRTENNNYNKKPYYTKKYNKDNDIVTNFFSNNAYNEKQMSKKFKDAKKRYSEEYDDE